MRAVRRGERGMTLLEVLVAMAILAVMMTIAWGTANTTIKAKKQYESTQDRYREVRFALSLIARDVGMAYVSSNEDRNQLEPRTQFVGTSGGDTDTLVFSALAHTPLYADANESDQTVIEYRVEASKDDRGKDDLLRRETRRLPLAEKPDQVAGQADVLLADVQRFKVQFWDQRDREWQDSWSTQNTNGEAPRLPDRVKITVVFVDERGKDVQIVTQTRLTMTELLTSYAN